MIEKVYLSGRLGRAIYKENKKYFIIDVHNTDKVEEYHPHNISYFFRCGAEYNFFYNDNKYTLNEIKETLKKDSHAHDALHFSISGMDVELNIDTCSIAIDTAEQLLQNEWAFTFVWNRLLSRPLPVTADIKKAIFLSQKKGANRLSTIYKEVLRKQKVIKSFLDIWSELSIKHITDKDKIIEAENILIDKGIFADLINSLFVNDFKKFDYLIKKANIDLEITQKIPEVISIIKDLKAHFSSEPTTLGKTIILEKAYPSQVITKKLRVGFAYPMAFLRVYFDNYTDLCAKYQPHTVKKLFHNFHEYVLKIIKSHDGFQISWNAEGGDFAFEEKACGKAVQAGIELKNKIKVFNLDKQQNFLQVPIVLHIASHWGVMIFRKPLDQIYSRAIEYLHLLNKNVVPPGDFYVTDLLYHNRLLANRFKKDLEYISKLENNTLYRYKDPAEQLEKVTFSIADMENARNKIMNFVKILLENLRIEISKKGTLDYEVLREYVEHFYNNIDFFYQGLSGYVESTSEVILNQAIKHLNVLLTLEHYINRKLEPLALDDSNSSKLLKVVCSRRITLIPSLKLLMEKFMTISKGEKDSSYISEKELFNKISGLIEANEFNEEIAFVELCLYGKGELIDYISNINTSNSTHDRISTYNKLKHHLWKLADFVLIEDKSVESIKLFPLLAQNRVMSEYFQVVQQLLQTSQNPDRKLIINQFVNAGVHNPTDEDIQIVLKCLLVNHSNSNIRKYILNNIDFHKLWKIIAYSKTPLSILREICDYLGQRNDSDFMKVFFDLVLHRLLNEIRNVRDDIPMHHIKIMIISFYKFKFFVEAGYFERLDDLHLKFFEKSKKFPDISIDIFKRIKDKHGSGGKVPVEIPIKILYKVPRPILRKLAREGHYIYFFINHSYPLIALETVRFININNIEHLLKSRSINGVLMARLLGNDELFRKNTVIHLAFNHPKCNANFARKYIHKSNATELRKIMHNVNANKAVTDMLKKHLMQRSKKVRDTSLTTSF